MSRTTTRIAGLAVTAAVVFGLSACGSDQQIPSADQPGGKATATAPAPAPTTQNNAGSSVTDPAATEAPPSAAPAEEVLSDAPQVAQAFTEQALGDVTIINSPSITDSVNRISAFLTDRVGNEILALGDSEKAFRLIPYKFKDLAPGQPATAASVKIDSMAELIDDDLNSVMMEVVATYTWEFGDLGSATGTRTYTLTLIPNSEADGMAWRIDSISGRDDNLREN